MQSIFTLYHHHLLIIIIIVVAIITDVVDNDASSSPSSLGIAASYGVVVESSQLNFGVSTVVWLGLGPPHHVLVNVQIRLFAHVPLNYVL